MKYTWVVKFKERFVDGKQFWYTTNHKPTGRYKLVQVSQTKCDMYIEFAIVTTVDVSLWQHIKSMFAGWPIPTQTKTVNKWIHEDNIKLTQEWVQETTIVQCSSKRASVDVIV